MGIGKLSGIANYGVNAVERNGGMRNWAAVLPRWGVRGCTHLYACARVDSTHASTCGWVWVHVWASIMYICCHWEVKSHYETDASQALGKLCLIGLTQTHQPVPTQTHIGLPVTSRCAYLRTLISYSVPNMASRRSLWEGARKTKWEQVYQYGCVSAYTRRWFHWVATAWLNSHTITIFIRWWSSYFMISCFLH